MPTRTLTLQCPRGETVTVTVTLTETAAPRLSIVGEIGPPRDPHICGQCADAIRAMLGADPFVRRLCDVWDRWHLNDMQAGCEHQYAAGWHTRPIDPSKPTNAYGEHIPGHSTWNMLAWVRPGVHPDGLLTVPCPECGYRYGTEWRYHALPADVVDFLTREVFRV